MMHNLYKKFMNVLKLNNKYLHTKTPTPIIEIKYRATTPKSKIFISPKATAIFKINLEKLEVLLIAR